MTGRLQGTLAVLCSLAVLSAPAAQDETARQNCTSQPELLTRLSADLKGAVECADEEPDAWTTQETAALLLSMRNLTGVLHTHLLQDCYGAEPKKCREVEVPQNGGLACVTVADGRFCKPLCNHGYDFNFLRRSSPYSECSQQTRFQWQTMYVGGAKLAECIESPIQVSGVKTAYFPEDQDCLTTKTSARLQSRFISDLIAELKAADVAGDVESTCLACG